MVVFTGDGEICVKGQGKFDVNYEDHRRTGLCLVRQAPVCRLPLAQPYLGSKSIILTVEAKLAPFGPSW